jgi:Arc/MetJ-type ribon-helix-helix transcriptional regulator
MSTLTIDISPKLYQNIEKRVVEGWFKDIEAAVEEALRRYIDSHPMDLTEQFIEVLLKLYLHQSLILIESLYKHRKAYGTNYQRIRYYR